MNAKELNRALIDMSERVERINATTDWLKAAREKEFNQTIQQAATPQTVTPITPTPDKYETLTPAKIKQQFELHGEEYLNETIAELGRQFPDQPHENKTKKLPDPPLPKTHEQILKMVKSGYSNEDILARFEA